MSVRIVRSYALPYSQNVREILQQFIDGEWREVPIVEVSYPLPNGRTNRGHLRDIG